VPELQRLRADHASAVLAFELANRAYFAASVSDRGDEFYDQFTEQHNALLAEQEAGTCAFHVLVGEDGSVLGRFNLVDFEDGTAELGARVLSVLGSTASTHRPRALPHSSTARAAMEVHPRRGARPGEYLGVVQQPVRVARRRAGARGQLGSAGRLDGSKIHTASLARAAIPHGVGDVRLLYLEEADSPGLTTVCE